MPSDKKIWTWVLAVGLGIGLLWLGFVLTSQDREQPVDQTEVPPPVTKTEEVVSTSTYRIIGESVEGRAIEYYEFGTGSTTLLLVGGIHGGYEWNSVLLAYEFIDAFLSAEIKLPPELKIGIIPALNPDGLHLVIQKTGRFTKEEIPPNNAHATGLGRFNSNQVDLNRNFDCKWQSESTWRNQKVSAGANAFSEPEAVALRDLVATVKPETVIFWHSQANAVYASECTEGVLPNTLAVMNAYAKAGNYRAVPSFDAYPVSGDAEGWLASLRIPAITVELETRTETEWSRNKAGVLAVMELLGK